jgi:ELWxxDGT repeat protein
MKPPRFKYPVARFFLFLFPFSLFLRCTHLKMGGTTYTESVKVPMRSGREFVNFEREAELVTKAKHHAVDSSQKFAASIKKSAFKNVRDPISIHSTFYKSISTSSSKEKAVKNVFFILLGLLTLAGTQIATAQTPNPVMIQNFLAATDSGTGNFCYNPNEQTEIMPVFNGALYFPWGTAGGPPLTCLFMKTDGNTVYNVKNMQGQNITPVNGSLYFSGYDQTNSWEFWKSDGSDPGTVLVKNTVTEQKEYQCYSFTPCGSTTFFFKWYAAGKTWTQDAQSLFKTNGTTAGTTLVKDFKSGSSSYYVAGGWYLNGNYVFALTERNPPNLSRELWKSDGTRNGTVMIKDFYPGTGSGFGNGSPYSTYGSRTGGTLLVNGKLYFGGNDGVKGIELCRTDGTAAGTVRLTDINPAGDACPADIVKMGDYLYFAANDGSTGEELWKYSLTAGTATRVKDIYAGSGSSDPYLLTVVGTEQSGQYLMFASRTAAEGVELWRSDGTEAGTVLVKDINPGPGDGRPDSYIDNNMVNKLSSCNNKLEFTSIGGKVYFSAYTPALGHELWESDGTSAGTVLVKDIWPGADTYGNGYSSNPRYLSVLGGKLIFLCYHPDYGWEWWKYDPTLPVYKVSSRAGDQPADFAIIQSYPNPISIESSGTPFATIVYSLDRDRSVILKIFDALGRAVKTLYEGPQNAGEHRAFFDAAGLPAGNYFCRLESEGRAVFGVITLTK